jgi:hypothetical protein
LKPSRNRDGFFYALLFIYIFILMLNSEGLKDFLQLGPRTNSPAVLIYAVTTGPRLKFAARFIFEHVLNCPVNFTTNEAGFKAASGIRINYSARPAEGVYEIRPAKLLFETGLSDIAIKKVRPDGTLSLQGQSGEIFDVFAAVFYMISRYEEWQQFAPDRHERFEAAESLLYGTDFFMKPVVEHWIAELKGQLESFYQVRFPLREFRVISTIDVDNLFAYKNKGVLRTSGASFRDMLKFDFRNLLNRLNVLRGKKNDPFDIYEEISDFCFTERIPLIWFFLFRSGNMYDRTVSPGSGAFENVFAILKKNFALIGLHPSYSSAKQKNLVNE